MEIDWLIEGLSRDGAESVAQCNRQRSLAKLGVAMTVYFRTSLT